MNHFQNQKSDLPVPNFEFPSLWKSIMARLMYVLHCTQRNTGLLYYAYILRNPTAKKSSFNHMESKHECFILYFLGNVMRGWGMCYQGIRVVSSYPLIQANGPISK